VSVCFKEKKGLTVNAAYTHSLAFSRLRSSLAGVFAFGAIFFSKWAFVEAGTACAETLSRRQCTGMARRQGKHKEK